MRYYMDMAKPSFCGLVVFTAILVLSASYGTGQARSSVSTQQQALVPIQTVPDHSNLLSLRFVTDNDYPPFNYLDENGNLVGFNVELAKAICTVLKVKCSVQALNWERMINAIDNNAADAIIASLAITRNNRRKVAFSSQYYQTPARFVARKSDNLKEITPENLAGKRIGVTKNTSHEAYLRAFFKGSLIKSYNSPDLARKALLDGQLDTVFGDGVSLMFWLNGSASDNCCSFVGGAFTESKFFGEGVGIAVKKQNTELLAIVNHGLEQIKKSGKYQELFDRFFPMNFY